MSNSNLFRLHFSKPIVGTVREDDRRAGWEIWYIECLSIAGDQSPPPDDLVFAVHRRMRDEDGNVVPVEVLSTLDLQAGFRDAYRREFAIARATVSEG
ncbi:hypothetical protein [Novosphingobium sp.]|uniref:hypothetical protein n=1 Tax=Novosphingobium sp. TaxID=1874826 RepID=UPI0035676085